MTTWVVFCEDKMSVRRIKGRETRI